MPGHVNLSWTPWPLTISQFHLHFKILESFYKRFKEQFSPNAWILANSGITEPDHRGPPTQVLSAHHPQNSQKQSWPRDDPLLCHCLESPSGSIQMHMCVGGVLEAHWSPQVRWPDSLILHLLALNQEAGKSEHERCGSLCSLASVRKCLLHLDEYGCLRKYSEVKP